MEGFSNQLKNIRLHDVQLFMEPEQAIDKRSRNGFLFDGVENCHLQTVKCTGMKLILRKRGKVRLCLKT